MHLQIKLSYEGEWVAYGEGIYVTASSLLDLRDRLLSRLQEKEIPTPCEIKVFLDKDHLPYWVIEQFRLKKEMIWKL